MLYSLEIILKPEAQELLGHFSSLLDVRVGYFAPNGREIHIGGGRPICHYCQLLRQGCDSACRALDKRMFARARKTRDSFYYACHGGLTEAFVPVDMEANRIGLIMVGQFRKKGQAPPPDGTPFMDEYKKRPVFSDTQIKDMLRMLELMVQSIIDRHLVAQSECYSIQPLLDYIHAHPEQTITVAEGAAMIGRSTSSTAHLFKRLIGQSIREYQIEQRLNAAERMLCSDTSATIKEIAYRLGFDDPLYFSRLYRKRRGQPPSRVKGSC